MRQIKLLCLLLALGFQSIQAQEHKHAGLTGKEKTIVIQPIYTSSGGYQL